MQRFYWISLSLYFVFNLLTGQEYHSERVPKQYSFEAGYKYNISSDFQHTASNGISFAFDYAWQVSGLTGIRPPAYISIPIDYTYFFIGQENDTSMRMLTYGWTVKHLLTKDKKINPYFGYSLLLNQLKISEKEGSLIGHQTKFILGINFKGKKAIPYIQGDYNMTRFPKYNIKGSNWVHSFSIKSGIRF